MADPSALPVRGNIEHLTAHPTFETMYSVGDGAR